MCVVSHFLSGQLSSVARMFPCNRGVFNVMIDVLWVVDDFVVYNLKSH